MNRLQENQVFPLRVQITPGRNTILAAELKNRWDLKNKPLITFNQANIGYGADVVLCNVSWVIREGENWVLSGANGIGKTTLLHAIIGQARIHSGSTSRNVLDGEQQAALSDQIKMVSFSDTRLLYHNPLTKHYYQQRYQAFDSEGHDTVSEFLREGGYQQDIEMHQRIVESFGLRPLLNLERIKLSSGQSRKLLLCRALFDQPKLLLLDNPHIGLDAQSRAHFNDLIDQMVFDHQVVVILSGQIHQLPRCISHQLHIENNHIFRTGPRSYPFIPTRSGIARLSSPQKFALQKIQHYYLTAAANHNASTVVELDNVTVAYNTKPVIENLTWKVHKGEKWSIRGGNGVGKSTLLSLLYADHPQAYSNRVFLFGNRRGQGESIWEIKEKMGFTSPELHAYFPSGNSGADVIASGWKDALFRLKPDPRSDELAKLYLDYFQLAYLFEKPWIKMSTGEQRILLFIRALIKAPSLLLLDEPFQGMDLKVIELCQKLLDTILTDQHTLIFISHYQSEIPLMVTRELVITEAEV